MKILLDECVDVRLANEISGHQVETVLDKGWSGIKDGRLLALAEQEFDVFVTVDRNLPFQQNLSKFNLRVIILEATPNRLAALQPLVPLLIVALPKATMGEAYLIEMS